MGMRFVFAAVLVGAAAAGGNLPAHGKSTALLAWIRLDCQAAKLTG
jgi:hypothetical protein